MVPERIRPAISDPLREGDALGEGVVGYGEVDGVGGEGVEGGGGVGGVPGYGEGSAVFGGGGGAAAAFVADEGIGERAEQARLAGAADADA